MAIPIPRENVIDNKDDKFIGIKINTNASMLNETKINKS